RDVRGGNRSKESRVVPDRVGTEGLTHVGINIDTHRDEERDSIPVRRQPGSLESQYPGRRCPCAPATMRMRPSSTRRDDAERKASKEIPARAIVVWRPCCRQPHACVLCSLWSVA